MQDRDLRPFRVNDAHNRSLASENFHHVVLLEICFLLILQALEKAEDDPLSFFVGCLSSI